MMSSSRGDYASASEWLSALRQDDAWVSQQQRLETSTPADTIVHQNDALRRIGQGDTFEFWEIYGHQVEPVISEVWDIAELSLPKLKIQAIGMLSMEWIEQRSCGGQSVPEKLTSKEAKKLMESLMSEDLLTEDWQPKELSGTERALVAKAVCERLKINAVWQVFGQLWDENPETLRSYFNKAMEQKKSLKFQEKLKNIFD